MMHPLLREKNLLEKDFVHYTKSTSVEHSIKILIIARKIILTYTLLSDLDNEASDHFLPEVFFVHAQDILAPARKYK